MEFDIFPAATECIFARDCMWASFHMSRSVEMEVFLKMSRTENQLPLRDEETCSGACLTCGEWKNHLLEEPTGSMLTARVHVFSESVFCTGPGAFDSVSASKFSERMPKAVMKSDTCNTRNDIAAQSIDGEWHV